jgi:hypothetical protein
MSNYLDELNKAEPSITITPTPLIMDKIGDSFRGLYVGMQSFEKDGRLMPVAHFYDGVGIRFNMGAQLTRAVSMLKPGISVEIKLTELKANTKGGKTKIYSVTPLKIALVNLDEMFGGVLSITAPAPEHLISSPAPVIDNDEVDELTAAGIPRKTFTQAALEGGIFSDFNEIGGNWVGDYPHYQNKDGGFDAFHFLKAAGAEGYAKITAENMLEVFDRVSKRQAQA